MSGINTVVYTTNHGHINHGLATHFKSYRVTLNSRKTRDLFEISSYGNSTSSALSANARINR